MRRPWLLLVLLIVAPVATRAADPGRQSALLLAPLRSGAPDALLEDILSSELTATLSAAQIAVSPTRLALSRAPGQPTLPEEERVSRLLAGVDAAGVDVIVAAFYLIEGEQLTIQFALYDPAVKIVLGGVLTRARKGLTVFASVSGAVGEFEPAVRRYVEGGYRVEPPSGIVERIEVRGPPEGSRVVLVDKEFGIVSGGRLVVPYSQFEIGTAIPVKVMKDGYHGFEGTYPLPSAQVTLALPALCRETRFDADVRWSFGFATGIGFGARVHLVPDSLFLGVEHYRTVEVPSLSTPNTVGHYDTNLHIGQYIVFPYTSPFRLHVSAGVGLIVTDVQGLPGREYTDFYVLVADPTAELTLGPVTLFLRPDLHYSLGFGYNLLGREWIRTAFGIPPITVGARLSW